MSEYQYDEFQAIDRPLTDRQISEVREISTRATITRTLFSNYYVWRLESEPARSARPVLRRLAVPCSLAPSGGKTCLGFEPR